MTKPGSEYEEIVGEICKDWKNPVGVAMVDALDSKRRDLEADLATIYSNSGFTENAKRKATRVGISLCSAVKAGDSRIRVGLKRDFYARSVTANSWSLSAFWHPDRQGLVELDPYLLHFQGKPLVNWLSKVTTQLLREHQDRPHIQAQYTFHDEIEFICNGDSVHLAGLKVHLSCSIGWAHQAISEDVTLGSYDFLSRKLTIPNCQMWEVGPFVTDAWKPVEAPPPESPMEPNSIRLNLTIVRSIGLVGDAEAPGLDEHVAERAISFDALTV